MIFRAKPALPMALALFLAAGCAEESSEPSAEFDLAPFKAMARAADCADFRNHLYLIDGELVLWERSGNCPDNGYSVTLYASTMDQVLCGSADSIAGPMSVYQDENYREMFDTMAANLNEPDLGLGAGHTVESVSF